MAHKWIQENFEIDPGLSLGIKWILNKIGGFWNYVLFSTDLKIILKKY